MAPYQEVIETSKILASTLREGVFVDTLSLLCSDGCPQLTLDGQLISYDGEHLTKEGAAYLGQVLFSTAPLRKYVSNAGMQSQ